MKGILSNKDKIEINPIALNYQFTIHSMVPAPHTIIDGINKLEPGHILNVTKSGETLLKKYFMSIMSN
jgi:asparagine synthase (glutamine-hydrolysing)